MLLRCVRIRVICSSIIIVILLTGAANSRKSPVNCGISIVATVLEIAEMRHFSLGDGIFLRSFVLCGFSIVSKSEVPEGQLETKFAPGSNPGWMSERTE